VKPVLKTTAAACLAASMTVLAGCGAGAEPADQTGPVQLTFWHGAQGAAATTLTKLVADFNAKHGGSIQVAATYQGSYDDTIAKLSAGVRGGQLPNLVQINDVNTSFMVDSGLATPVQDLMSTAAVSYDFDALVPAVKNYYTVDGKVWSMPFQVSQPALIVNPSILKAAGLNPADVPTDLAGVAEWAQVVKDKTNTAGLTLHQNAWWLEELTSGAGLEYCTPGNGVGGAPVTGYNLTDPQQIAQWTTLQGLFRSGAALNVGADFSAATNAFASGKVAMLLASSGALGNIETAAAGKYEVKPYPVEGSTGGVAPGGNSVWVLRTNESDAQKNAAAEFTQFIGSSQSQQEIFTATGFLPTTKQAQQAVTASATAPQKALLTQLTKTPSNPATAGCHHGSLQQVRGEVKTAMEKVISGSDVAQTLAAAQTAATEMVKAYNDRAGATK
jgi:sn-glycerol 3-phosphate transport system substrate-binding protein